MKKSLFFVLIMFIATLLNAQTVLFHKSFDTPPNYTDSVTASGALNNFAINTRLFYNGTRCDSTLVTPNDTAFLTTNSFSTVGLPYVFLSFSHICKIELLDGGEVQVSINNGVTWTTLTGTEYVNPGNSQFVSSGNKFNSNSYPLDWFPLQNATKPAQTWWKNENFNISALVGNQPNVKIRFALRDGNGNGANFAHGWYIDNIIIKGAISELTPPSVHLIPPVFQDTIGNTGPYDISAYIQDASGIDTAYILYKVNNGPNLYVPMAWISDSLYRGTIPSYTYTNSICYTVFALDNSASHNVGSTGKCFYIKRPTVAVIVGTGTSTSSNLPTNGQYNWGWGSMIYKVSELNFSGTIDTISFYVNNAITGYQMLNQKIFIGHTGLTSFGTAQPDTTSMIKVFTGNVTFNGAGWSGIKLSVPFTYNGLNNLAIYWVNKDGANVTGFPLFRYTATTTSNCAYNANNAYSSVFPTSLGTTTLNRPNIRISYIGQPFVNDAGITQILSPTGTVVGSVPVPIRVSLKNFGSDTLRNVTIKWSLDGVYQDSINWSGAMAEAVVSLPYTIDNSTFTPGTHTIRAWTVRPNGFTDPNSSNNEALITFYSCNEILHGTYTIGPSGNYASINTALVAMQNCGISGPVVFNIAAGTYTEAITISPISGASATNTVTFQSANGVNTSVILQYAGSSAADNWVVRLNGADYIQFKNLTIKSTTANNFGRVVELINGANYNRFEGNIIQSVVSSTSTTAGVYCYTSASDNFNVFLNNKIQNGYYGVYFYGTTSLKKQGNQFIGNEITGWNYYGMYLYYNDSVRIEKNLIQNGPASTTNYHIYSYYNGFGCRIIKNRIQSSGSGTFYGIAVFSPSGGALTPNVIANNFISQSNVTGTGYGIYLSTANFTNVYYNSINITGTSTTGRGLYVTGGTTGINIMNNILSNTGGGYAIYISTTTPINKCDHNNLFATGSALGYWTTNCATLTAWKTASLKDSNSVSGNPEFTSLNDLHTFASIILYKGKPLVEVTDDIDNQIRSLTLPSIGADETQKLNYDIALDSVISPQSSCQLTSAELVKVRITNKGLNPMSNISVYYTINGGAPVMGTYTGTIDTSTSITYTFPTPVNVSAPGNYLFDFYVSHPSDMSSLNDSLNNKWVNGSYNLSVAAYTQSFESNENFTDWTVINSGGGTYKWIVPYTGTTYAHSGTNSAQFFNSTTNVGEDWLFSRCFNLQAGQVYSMSFWYRATNTTAASLTLKYGLAPNSAAMNIPLTVLPSITSTSYQESISQFTVATTGTYYFGFSGSPGISNNLYIDDINLKLIPEQDAVMENISAPSTGCGLTTAEPVTVRIKNAGSDTIAGNLTVFYKINNGTPVSAPITNQIIPGDTLLFTFPTTVDMAVTLNDVTFNFKAWVSLTNDPNHTNDTLIKQVISRHSPLPPSVIGATVNYGQSASLQANSSNTVYWYADNATSSSFHQGQIYNTPLLFDTTTYFVEAIEGAPGQHVGPSTNTIGAGGAVALSYYLIFDVLAPTMRLEGVYVYPGATGNVILYIANSAGTVLTTVTYPVTTTNVKTYIPIQYDIPAGTNYRIGYNSSSGGVSLYRNTAGASYPYTLPGVVSITGNSFSGYPQYYYYCYDWQIGSGNGCSSARVPVTANVIIPSKEIAVDEIISPVNNCTFGTEVVKAKLINYGTDAINIPFTAGYYVSGNPTPVTETVSTPIPAGDSIIYTFSTPATTAVSGGNIPFTFKVFANVTGDPWQVNDTLSKTVTLSYSPPDPVCTDATVPYGTSATLTATSTVPVYWYSSPVGGTLLGSGLSYNTPLLYGNTTFYAEANTTIPGFTTQAGTGSSTSSNVPTNGFYDYSWSSSLFLNTDLNFIGRIDTLMFYATNAMSAYQMLDQRIYLKHVTGNTLTNVNNPNVSAMSLVFQGSITWTGPGWNKIALTNPFYYNGSDNLELAWENRDGGNASGNPVFQVSTVPANMVKHQFQNGSFPTGAGTWLTTRPNTKFYHIGFGCPSNRVPVNAFVTGLPNIDAGLLAFASPVSPISLGGSDIKVVLTNFGSDTLHSVQINLEVNGVGQLPYNWLGSLPTNGVDTVTVFNNYNFTYVPYPGLNNLRAWTQNPNATVDPTPANDTIVTQIDAHDPLSGVYYIRTATPDFNSFSEAILPLFAWGINGPVTFIADTGTYNEHISIPQIPGASSVNTVTFQSITGINTDVKLQYAATGSLTNYVVQLDGADYVNINDISIIALSTNNYGRVVEIKNGATNNSFERNRIVGLQITTNNSTPVYCNDISCSDNVFIGNDLINGYQSVYVYGSPTNKIKGFKFLNNKLQDFYNYGFYLYYTDSVLVSGNQLNTNSAAANNYSVYAFYCDNNSRFEKNKITYSGTGSFYGLYIANSNASSTAFNWIANNFVSNTGSSGIANGIYLADNNYLNVYYNSVNITSGNTISARALYQSGGTSNVNIKNNNLANVASGYAYYINTPGSLNISDYNNLFTNGSLLAYWTADRSNLAALQAASLKDVHSKSVNPGYITTTNLHTYQLGIVASGNPVTGITTDIDNDIRSTTNPCIGADEFNPAPIDAGVTLINAPVNPALVGSQPIKVTIANYGFNTINNMTIRYSVNGVLAGTYNWVGTLVQFDTIMNLNIGNVTLSSGNSLIRAWTRLPNGIIDTNSYNDTASSSVIVCGGALSGTYTIGGVSPNFYSFADALTALSTCGISGPVVFNIASGIYNERINLGLISGVSAINTITFQSASGNNNDVTIQAAGTATTDNYVIQLNGARYTRFKNMTIKSTTASTYGRVVTFINNSDYNIFQGNKIQSIIGTSTNASAVFSTGGNMDYNKFINNEIKGGYYSIYWYATSTALNKANEFRNNSIFDWYYYGIYLYYNDSVVVAENTTHNGSNTATGYHIYSNYGDNGCRYEKNMIYGNNTGAFYGLAILYNDGTASEPTIVANNMISEINGTTTAYGLYLSYSNYANVYYNSVNIKGGSSTAGRALYSIGGSQIKLLNNNLVNSGTGFAYYNGTLNSIVQSDYNNLYTTSAVYGYWNGNVSNLAAMQAASSLDAHSVSSDPVFVSVTDLHATSAGIDGKATPIAGFTTDIDGNTRNTTTPDIGADEFAALPFDVAVEAFIQPSGISASAGSSKVVTVQIRNFGTTTITSIPVRYKYANQNVVTGTWTGSLASNQTVSFPFTTPITVLAGTNTLCAYTAMTNDQNISNDTLCMNFSGIPVELVPYADDFEGINYFYAAGTNSSWEFGTPASTVINSAHSPSHAWKTNLDGYYSANESSSLYTSFFNFTMVNNATLDFWHYYVTEAASTGDGGRIKYSLNGGSTWITLGIYPNDPAGTNWYNANIGGKPSWSGNSGGWVHSTYNLSTIPNIVNAVSPVQFMFEFESNASNSNYDGWAVDDFSITAPPIAKDAGVTAILLPNGATQTGAPVTVQVTIKNFGTDTMQAIPVRYFVNSSPVVSGNWTGVLNPGATTNYTFTQTFVSPGSTYSLCAFTKKTGDIYWNNDTTCGSYPVTPASKDVGVLSILWPNDTIAPGIQDSVKIRIKNFGLSTETSIPVSYKINGVMIGAGNWTGTLAPGQTTDYKFATLYVTPLGNYAVCAKTQLTGDLNTANDELCFNNFASGMFDYEYSLWNLLQNVPNPANASTLIGFEIPAEGNVRFELYDILGNKILNDEHKYPAGKNQIEIDVSSIPAGIYFYSAKYKNMVRTKRMVITK